MDPVGRRVPVRVSAIIVPALGRNVFSSVKAMQSGVSTVLETGNPDLHFDSSTTLLLNVYTEGMGLCSNKVFRRALRETVDASNIFCSL